MTEATSAPPGWATEEDRLAVLADCRVFGNGYAVRGSDGLLRRQDPVGVIVVHPPASCPACQAPMLPGGCHYCGRPYDPGSEED